MKNVITSLVVLASLNAGANDLTVHEWGTFTSFMGADGKIQEGLHHEEEPLPNFVYGLKKNGNISTLGAFSGTPDCPSFPTKVPCGVLGNLSLNRGQSLPVNPLNAGITQKMETPVIYFYGKPETKVNVVVDFPKGIISQYYPKATTYSPKAEDITTIGPSQFVFDVKLRPVDFVGNTPATAFNSIWNPAREVKANTIEVDNEHEKFIFYRGVADFPSILKVESPSGNILKLTNLSSRAISSAIVLNSNREKGIVKVIGAIKSGTSLELPRAEDGVAFDEYVEQAKKVIISALVNQGLFKDEAKAMVNTWEKSYFHTPGPRVLFLLPQIETEKILPLTLNPAPKNLVRVLVGRIEIMTKAQEDAYLDILESQAIIFSKEQTFGRFYDPKLRRLRTRVQTSDLIPDRKSLLLKRIDALL